MALLGNYSVLNKTPGKWLSGGSTAGTNQAQCRSNWSRCQDWRNFSNQDASGGTVDSSKTRLSARPLGGYTPGIYALPSVAGAMSAHSVSYATISATGSGALGVAAVGSTTLSLSISGTGSLIVSAVGSFTVDLSATANILAALLGTGSFTVSLDGGTTTLTGEGNMVGATTLSVEVDLTAYATGELSGDWTADYGTFTPELLANAVWNALTTDYATSGTMGAAMSAAGSAGDPWTTTLPGSYTGDQAGYILTTIKRVLVNAQKTDPATGLRTVYDDTSSYPLLTANVFNDAAGTILFNGTAGINKTNKLS